MAANPPIGVIPSEIYGLLSAMPMPEPSKFKRNQLSNRERETVLYVSQGLTTTDIAAQLRLSRATIETYRREIIRKLGVNNLAHAVGHCLRNKLIE